MPRFWRRLRRIRRSNIVATVTPIALIVLMAVLGGSDEAEIFEPPESVSRAPDAALIIPAGEPIVLGFSGPLTGPLTTGNFDADAAIAGVLRWKELNGDLIHGHPVDLVGEDDGGTEEDVAIVAATLLLERPRLVAIVGPSFSAAAEATIETYARAGVVMISGSATATGLTLSQPQPTFFFRTAFTNADQGPLQGDLLIERIGVGTAFIIDDGEAYGLDLADSAQAHLTAAGWDVQRDSIAPNTVDFTELVGRVISAGSEAVVFEGFNPEGALLLAQLRDAGYEGLFVAGDGVASERAFLQVLGDTAEGALLTGCPQELPTDFQRLWQAGGGGDAPVSSLLSNTADAAYVLMDAVARVAVPQTDGTLVIDPLALRAAIAETDIVGWASGQRVVFDDRGDRGGDAQEAGLIPCEVRDGRFVEVAS